VGRRVLLLPAAVSFTPIMVVALLLSWLTLCVGSPALLPAVDLRVEGLRAPLGVDTFASALGVLFSWVPAASAGSRGVAVTGFRLEVSSAPDFGAGLVYDSGFVASNASSARAPPSALGEDARYYFRVTWRGCELAADGGACAGPASDAPPSSSAFVTGLAQSTWGLQQWLSCATVGACDYLRSPAFALPAAPLRATLHLCTAGWVEAWVNGQRAGGDAALEGSWTQFNKRMPCTAYDVAPLLAPGTSNALGLVLGNGWWGHLGHRATASALLSIELAAGERLYIGTDAGSWRGSAGPIVADDIYDGEAYEMQREIPGWSLGAFNLSAWDATAQVGAMEPLLQEAARSWQAVQPVVARRNSTIAARTVTRPSPAQYVVDFGVNSAGWTRLLLPGGCPAGASVALRHAEVLFPDGTIDQGNYRTAKATDTLLCDGRAQPYEYEPRFTYRGHRFVGVEGWPGPPFPAPTPSMFLKVEVHNAVEHGGDATPSALAFSSASQALPLIHELVRRGQLSNLHGGVPTDCPQRNERQGWMADASVSAESAISSWDMRALYTSWLRTIIDAQGSAVENKDCDPKSPIYPDCQGADTDTSPHMAGLYGNRPADPSWGSALDIVYDLLLRYWGDGAWAEGAYPSLAAYTEYLLRVADASGGLVVFHYYGDWLQPNQVASTELVSQQTSAFNYLRSLRSAINAAAVLGHAEDAERWTARYLAGAAAYNAAFFNASGSGCYGGGRQNEQVYPAYLSLVPGGDAAVPAFVERCLLPAIAANGTHVDTGIISTKYLMPLLSRAGHSPTALALALAEDFPSWAGMSRVFNQTAITEHWNPSSNPSGNSMSSRNHPALGSVGAWLYQALLGVRLGDDATANFQAPGLPPGVPSPTGRLPQDGYGFSRAVVAPEVVEDPRLTGAQGGVWTASGWVGASWLLQASGILQLNASFPVGVRGEVRTPGGGQWAPSRVTVVEALSGGKTVWAGGAFEAGVPGVFGGGPCSNSGLRLCLAVGSGDYAFVVQNA
jgi:alpha-L-rhamnosidase